MSDESIAIDEALLIREAQLFYANNYHLLPDGIDPSKPARAQESKKVIANNLSKTTRDEIKELLSPEELEKREARRILRAKRRQEKKAVEKELHEAEIKATELVAEVKKNPTQRKRICAALAKGEKAVDQMISIVVGVIGVNALAGVAMTTGINPPALVIATTLLIASMGAGYFCAEA
jgi:alanyl-tRNA synthetase